MKMSQKQFFDGFPKILTVMINFNSILHDGVHILEKTPCMNKSFINFILKDIFNYKHVLFLKSKNFTFIASTNSSKIIGSFTLVGKIFLWGCTLIFREGIFLIKIKIEFFTVVKNLISKS